MSIELQEQSVSSTAKGSNQSRGSILGIHIQPAIVDLCSRTRSVMTLLGVTSCVFLSAAGCTPSEPNELDKLGTSNLTIKDSEFQLWIADDDSERARGLMFITEEQMAPISSELRRGMVFVFDHEVTGSFWMKNTIIPLDIAYIASDGTIVRTYTMAPLDTDFNKYPPGAPYRVAIEVNGGVWKALGLTSGDRIDIPESLLNQAR